MKRIKQILKRILFPSKMKLICIPVVSFIILIFILTSQKSRTMPAYLIYCMSAYSLVIWLLAVPSLTKRIKSAIISNGIIQKITATPIIGKYLNDLAFRGNINICQGMIVNYVYVIFRVITGIRYTSVWFISMAVYYLVLGTLRTYLVYCYYHRNQEVEYRCYRKTAWMLFLLNIPMGGMIVLMVRTNSGFTYPGYIIYLSALYTFYTMITAAVNVVKFRKLGSSILSAAKILNFISAMMSILGLQTAMISRFSENGDNYRKTMNAITGGFVYCIVIFVAVFMLICSRKNKKEGGNR